MSLLYSYSHLLQPRNVQLQHGKNYWYWVNLQFNLMNNERREALGPDRTCAEWILRIGGSVKFHNKKHISDYNELPSENAPLLLSEIDASNTWIMHQGFDHFIGCKGIKKLIFNNCYYVNDMALQKLRHLKSSLEHLEVSQCKSVTDSGLLTLKILTQLKIINLSNLKSVKNMDGTIQDLKNNLPGCKINVG